MKKFWICLSASCLVLTLVFVLQIALNTQVQATAYIIGDYNTYTADGDNNSIRTYEDGDCTAYQDVQVIANGSCGTNVLWKLDAQGALTISGSGAMTNFSYSSPAPWNDSRLSIKTVIIESGVTNIGADAFSSCINLSSITIPDSVTTIGESAFHICKNLTDITIPDSVTSIGRLAFYACSNLTSITIPNKIVSINESTFYYCYNLTSIDIPASVTTIGFNAFGDCPALSTVTYCGTQEQWNAINISIENDKNAALTDASLQFHKPTNGICSLCNHSFWEYTIRDGNVTITGYTGNESNLTIPALIENMPVTAIGSYAFKNCTDLVSIGIASGITSIGSSAFSGCSNLANVYITDVAAWCFITFENESANPFDYAEKLYLNGDLVRDLIIPNGITIIPKYAFRGCKSLVSVIIPEGVISIGEKAFQGTSLTEIIIPQSVTSIGKNAFYGCTQLEKMTIPFVGESRTSNKILGRLFGSTTVPYTDPQTGAILYKTTYDIPSSLKIVIVTDDTSISSQAFKNCEYIETVILPNTLTSVNTEAFSDCTNLENIFYYGAADQWEAITTGAGNDAYDNATKHDAVENSVFAEQDGYYCLECDKYFDCYGDYLLATVTFKNWDGTVLSTKTYHYREKVVVPSNPTKPADNTYAYTFNGWDKEVIDCIGNEIYIATYTRETLFVPGWFLNNGVWYYYNTEGTLATGWLFDGAWYYLNADGSMATGWVNDGGTWYYMNGGGAMVTGWLDLGGTWYYMNGSGAMVTGWLNDGGTWYYFNGGGAMVTGWLNDGGTWYYFNGSGAMHTGWLLLGNTWYYMNGGGAMVTGWALIDGAWYYMDDSGAWVA